MDYKEKALKLVGKKLPDIKIVVSGAAALSDMVDDAALTVDHILPEAFDINVKDKVSAAVRKAAIESKVARV